jgi:hypothetical protein
VASGKRAAEEGALCAEVKLLGRKQLAIAHEGGQAAESLAPELIEPP